MTRRQFSREFKLEAVRLVKEREVSVAQASRDLKIGESLLRRRLKDYTSDPGRAFPGQGQVRRLSRPKINPSVRPFSSWLADSLAADRQNI